MTTEMIEKRNHLKEVSGSAAILVEMGAVDSINEGIKMIYAEDGHTELKTFNQWINEGFHVKKGEKAFLLWAKPLHVQKNEPKPDGAPFFPIIYLFSNLQVETILKKLS